MDRESTVALIESLFRDWGPTLARHAYRLSTDRDAADDLVQESFIALYKAIRDGVEVENPRAWTLSVVRHLAAKRLRDRSRRGETLVAPEEMSRFEDKQLAPDAGSDEDVLGLFSVLSRREEEVILMRVEARKYKEIASELKISQKTVETLLARALRKLREAAKARLQGKVVPANTERHVPKTLQ